MSHREGAVAVPAASPRPRPSSRGVLGSVGECGRETENARERERVTAAVYTCFASSQIGVKLEQSDGQRSVLHENLPFAAQLAATSKEGWVDGWTGAGAGIHSER